MYTVSDLFSMYLKEPSRNFDVKVNINGVDYFNNSIVNFEIYDTIVAGDEFTIGTVIPSKLTCVIKTTDTIPTNAKIVPYIKMQSGFIWNYITNQWDLIEMPWNDDSTELIPLGEFYIDDRSYKNGVYTFTAYDKLKLTEQAYTSLLIYPATMHDVFMEICAQLGLEVTANVSTVLDGSIYEIPYKAEDYTMREMLSFISSSHGCSVRMSKDGKVDLVRFGIATTPHNILASDHFRFEKTNPIKTMSKIVVTYNTDGELLEQGTGTANTTINIYNPFIDETILANLYTTLNGFTYQPFTMDWKGLPNLDAGDRVSITDRNGAVTITHTFINKLIYNGGIRATTSASSVSEQSSEFAFKGPITQQVTVLNKTTVKQETPYYGVVIGKTNGIKIARSDNKSTAIFNSDKLAFQVDGIDAIYFDPISGKYKFNGTIEAADGVFDGTVKAGNILIGGENGYISFDNLSDQPTILSADDIKSTVVTKEWIATLDLKVGTEILMGSGAVIDWASVSPPDYSDIGGTKPPTDADNTSSVVGSRLTKIDANGIYTGTVEAEKINGGTISGCTLQTTATAYGGNLTLNQQYMRFFKNGIHKMTIGFNDDETYAGMNYASGSLIGELNFGGQGNGIWIIGVDSIALSSSIIKFSSVPTAGGYPVLTEASQIVAKFA